MRRQKTYFLILIFCCCYEKTEEDTYLLDATGSELHAKEDIIVESTGSELHAKEYYWLDLNYMREDTKEDIIDWIWTTCEKILLWNVKIVNNLLAN